ncbi:hypothetical protein DM02DRAFT_466804, partial [Periconia macrospinosa]
GNWLNNLPPVLWADRMTIRRSTGYSPAELITGVQPVMPIELTMRSWQTLPWSEVQSTSDLLAVRAKQFEWREEKIVEAVGRIERLRLEAAERWDSTKGHDRSLIGGELVLVWDSIRALDKSAFQKFADRWRGPYKIAKVEKTYYWLQELDGTLLAHSVHGNRLKRFYQMAPD